jgi:hypothetical protein
LIVSWEDASLCGAWAPLKSGGNCQHDLHIPLGDVKTLFFVIIASVIKNVDGRMAQPCQHCFLQ